MVPGGNNGVVVNSKYLALIVLATGLSSFSAKALETKHFIGGSPSFGETQSDYADALKLTPGLDYINHDSGHYQVSSRYSLKKWGNFSYTVVSPEREELFDESHLVYQDDDARTAAGNTAYWLDQTLGKLSRLGLSTEKPMSVKVHAYCDEMLNAYFSPYQNMICMGHLDSQLDFDGKQAVNHMTGLAYDGSVVVHEFGHAVFHHQNSLPKAPRFRSFGNDLMAAANEGQADFLANMVFGRSSLGEWMVKLMKEHFRVTRPSQLANVSNLVSLRDSDNDLSMDRHFYGEIHHDGKIWASALYNLAKTIGNDVVTELWMETIPKLADSDGLYEMAKKIIETDEAVNSAQNVTLIQQVFESKGILGHSPLTAGSLQINVRVIDNPEIVSRLNKFLNINMDVSKLNSDSKIGPGECAPVQFQITNASSEVISGLELFILDYALPEGVDNIIPQNRTYLGKLNPGQNTDDIFRPGDMKGPWSYLCNRNVTGEVSLMVALKSNAEGTITTKVKVNSL